MQTPNHNSSKPRHKIGRRFKVAGMALLTRMVLAIDDGVIVKVFYSVFSPDKSTDHVASWFRRGGGGARRRRQGTA